MPAVAGRGMNTATYIALLDCLHENIYSVGEPTAGDAVWCVKCYSYQIVKHVAGKYGVQCDSCKYARNYGGPFSAETKAISHSIRHLGHRVTVYGPENYEREFYHEPQLLEFDLPPF